MRCLHVALKLVASAVPMAAVAFVSSAPASAHARHSYRHVYAHQLHYSGRHLYAMNTNNFASRAPYTSQYFASLYAMGQSSFTGNGSALPARYDNVSTMAASQVGAAGLPASLVERVIRRESGANPRAVHAGNYGLMQIRLVTARAMGYTGSAAADQHDLRAALSRRRLSCRRRQREPRHRALFARLLRASQGAGLLALRVNSTRRLTPP